ncbi:MAG: LysR family transcriptional regulator, partial [Rhodospirillales bacterium]|nr:LysR family transcriptional regulator [Rhodospirillales bacterium]
MVKTESLQTFVAIVATGSLSGAARRLRLSKSVVSQRLAEMEQTLGVRLVAGRNFTASEITHDDRGGDWQPPVAIVTRALADQ